MSTPPTHHVPYHRAWITEDEINAVTEVMRSGWLTNGPRAAAFEQAFAQYKQSAHAIAVTSCTDALHLALLCLDLKPGDEVITSPMTFVATANTILHAGGKPIFADIEPGTMNLSPDAVAQKVSPRTRAILPIHVGGNPCRMDSFAELAIANGLSLIEDCAHAIEARYNGRHLGTFGLAGAFSFYPTKNITTSEGGMVITQDPATAERVRRLSRHGLDKGTYQRMEQEGTPHYDVLEPGFKMAMSDLQAAIGLSQLDKLEQMRQRRMVIKQQYDEAFSNLDELECIRVAPGSDPAYHLYQLLLRPEALRITRDAFVARARAEGVELSVNYAPVHLFTWYRKAFGHQPGDFPHAEAAGRDNISLPFFPALSAQDVAHVIQVIRKLTLENRR